MKKIKATFIGKDFQNGYRTSLEYHLNIYHDEMGEITVYYLGGDSSLVRYKNIFSFIENWSNISSI